MAVNSTDELNSDNLGEENKSYQEKIEERTEGREDEISTLREIIGSVGIVSNLLASCSGFPNIKADARLMGRLRPIFATRGLGDVRLDMMILKKDVQAITEILNDTAILLINEISDEINGLCLTPNGTINREASEEQIKIYNEMHPDEKLDISMIKETDPAKAINKLVDFTKENDIEKIMLGAFSTESTKTVDKLLMDESWRELSRTYDFKDEDDLDDIVVSLDEDKKEEMEEDLIQTVSEEEADEITVDEFIRDEDNAPLLEILDEFEKEGDFDPPLDISGRSFLFQRVNELKEHYSQDDLIAGESARATELIMRHVISNFPQLVQEAVEYQAEKNAERTLDAAIFTSDELLYYASIDLAINARKAEEDLKAGKISEKECQYKKKKYLEFIKIHGDLHENDPRDEYGIIIVDDDERDSYLEKQKRFRKNKLRKDLKDAKNFKTKTPKEQVKMLKRYVVGNLINLKNDKRHSAKDFLKGIETALGPGYVDWQTERIDEEKFLEFYHSIGGKGESLEEIYETGLSEINFSMSRFLTDRVTDLRYGCWEDVERDEDLPYEEQLRQLEEGAAEREKKYTFNAIVAGKPSNYKEAIQLSYIFNHKVNDEESNARLLKKEPELLKGLVDKQGNLTRDAENLYKQAFMAQIAFDVHRYNDIDVKKINKYQLREVLDVLIHGTDGNEVAKRDSLKILAKINPTLVKNFSRGPGINKKAFLDYYNLLSASIDGSEPIESFDELKKYSARKMMFVYEKTIGRTREIFSERVEELEKEGIPKDELKTYGITDFLYRKIEIDNKKQAARRRAESQQEEGEKEPQKTTIADKVSEIMKKNKIEARSEAYYQMKREEKERKKRLGTIRKIRGARWKGY